MVKRSTKKAEYETLEIIRFRLLLGKVVTGVDNYSSTGTFTVQTFDASLMHHK